MIQKQFSFQILAPWSKKVSKKRTFVNIFFRFSSGFCPLTRIVDPCWVQRCWGNDTVVDMQCLQNAGPGLRCAKPLIGSSCTQWLSNLSLLHAASGECSKKDWQLSTVFSKSVSARPVAPHWCLLLGWSFAFQWKKRLWGVRFLGLVTRGPNPWHHSHRAQNLGTWTHWAQFVFCVLLHAQHQQEFLLLRVTLWTETIESIVALLGPSSQGGVDDSGPDIFRSIWQLFSNVACMWFLRLCFYVDLCLHSVTNPKPYWRSRRGFVFQPHPSSRFANRLETKWFKEKRGSLQWRFVLLNNAKNSSFKFVAPHWCLLPGRRLICWDEKRPNDNFKSENLSFMWLGLVTTRFKTRHHSHRPISFLCDVPKTCRHGQKVWNFWLIVSSLSLWYHPIWVYNFIYKYTMPKWYRTKESLTLNSVFLFTRLK